MPFDGNGNWTSNYYPQSGELIKASDFNNTFIADIANGFGNCVTRDGQGVMQTNTNANNYRVINVANPVNDKDAVNLQTLTGGDLTLAGDLTFTGNNTFSGSTSFTGDVSFSDADAKASIVGLCVPDYSRSTSASTGTSVQSVSVDSELRVFFINVAQESSFARCYISLCDSEGTATTSGIISCRSGYEGSPTTSGAIIPAGSYFKVEVWSGFNVGTTLQLTPLKGV